MFNKEKSFTLLEVIVAITVLTVAVGGIFSLIQQTLVAASLNESKLRAYYLAQEGIELVKNIRDSNWLEQRTNPTVSWDEDLDIGDWQADFNDTGLTQPFSQNSVLNINAQGFYSYDVGEATPFKRKISISSLESNVALEVRVQVLWSERGRNHTVEVVEHIYNWWYGYE